MRTPSGSQLLSAADAGWANWASPHSCSRHILLERREELQWFPHIHVGALEYRLLSSTHAERHTPYCMENTSPTTAAIPLHGPPVQTVTTHAHLHTPPHHHQDIATLFPSLTPFVCRHVAVICHWKHPTEQQEQRKTITSPPPATCLPYSIQDGTLSCSQCFALQPDISLPFVLYYLFNDEWLPSAIHTLVSIYMVPLLFVTQKNGFEVKACRWNKSSADINIVAGGRSGKVLFE